MSRLSDVDYKIIESLIEKNNEFDLSIAFEHYGFSNDMVKFCNLKECNIIANYENQAKLAATEYDDLEACSEEEGERLWQWESELEDYVSPIERKPTRDDDDCSFIDIDEKSWYNDGSMNIEDLPQTDYLESFIYREVDEIDAYAYVATGRVNEKGLVIMNANKILNCIMEDEDEFVVSLNGDDVQMETVEIDVKEDF